MIPFLVSVENCLGKLVKEVLYDSNYHEVSFTSPQATIRLYPNLVLVKHCLYFSIIHHSSFETVFSMIALYMTIISSLWKFVHFSIALSSFAL